MLSLLQEALFCNQPQQYVSLGIGLYVMHFLGYSMFEILLHSEVKKLWHFFINVHSHDCINCYVCAYDMIFI